MFYLCFLAVLSSAWGKEHAPVLIWGDYDGPGQSPPVPGLSHLRSFQFSQLLHHLITHRPHVLLFTEHNLSVEDFSWRDCHETTPFPHIRNLSQTSKGRHIICKLYSYKL